MSAANGGFLDTPALQPPPGVVPQFDNPPNLNTITWITIALCLGLSTVAVALRCFVKAKVISSWDIEDYLTVVGWTLQVSFSAVLVVTTKSGAGIHQWNLSLKDLSSVLHHFNTLTALYAVTTAFIRLSILTQYLRIFVPPGKRDAMFWGCWIISVLMILYIPAMFLLLFICTPRDKFWKPWIEGTCRNINDLDIAAGVINAVTILALIILPMNSLRQLNMPRKQKNRISFIFLLGVFALASSVIRTYYAVALELTLDTSYNIQPMNLWILAEFATAIISSCIPSFPILYKVVRIRLPTWVQRFAFSTKKKSIEGGNVRVQDAMRPALTGYGIDIRTVSFGYTNISEWDARPTITISAGRQFSTDTELALEGEDGHGIRVVQNFVIETTTHSRKTKDKA